MKIRQALKAVLPPILTQVLRRIRCATMPATDGLTFAPRGWETEVPPESGYECSSYLAHERDQWHGICEPFIRRLNACQAPSQILNGSIHMRIADHNSWMTYAYVLALAAHHKSSLKILDYGGSLGYFYWIGKALLPGVVLEYHCKELPEIAREGRKFTPQAIWHTDDSCLDQQYDVLIFSGVLPYIQEWQSLLCRASDAAKPYLLLALTPVVERAASYVARQRFKGATMLHQQINKAELERAISSARLRLVREFLEGEPPLIHNAPEQPSWYGCLLQRDSEAA